MIIEILLHAYFDTTQCKDEAHFSKQTIVNNNNNSGNKNRQSTTFFKNTKCLASQHLHCPWTSCTQRRRDTIFARPCFFSTAVCHRSWWSDDPLKLST